MDQATYDTLDLAGMGYQQALSRKFTTWSMLALAFSILGTWSTFAQDLAGGLMNGGPVSILWGLCLVTFCNLCVVASLGELCSGMPTALGQAYWIFRLWRSPWARFVSYLCAWINVFGWWTLTASQIAFMTNFMIANKAIYDAMWPGPNRWLLFVVYLGVTLLLTLLNAGACRKDSHLPWFNNILGIQFGALLIIFSLAMLISVAVRSDLHYQPAGFVFGQWINRTGWPDGVVWFMGLLQGAYGLTAFDSVIHMSEEIPAPRVNIPRVLLLAVIIGAVTGALFMVFCLFCLQDLDQILDSPTDFPFTELVSSTVGLKGTLVLIVLFEINGLGQGLSIMTATSRLTWGFARDGGLPWSIYLSHIDTYWNVPMRVLWAEGFLIAVVGVLYLFSNTVLQAVLSVSTISLTISYGMPIIILVYVGRDQLPPRRFHLGRWGLLINWISIGYCVVTTVFFFFPGSPRPSSTDMNYAIAVFGVMLAVAVMCWFVKGRSFYLVTDRSMLEAIRAQGLHPAAEQLRAEQIRFYLESDRSRLAAPRLMSLWTLNTIESLV
ncbi:Hnm1p [Penicillium daleae]|uniref:Hnm1p n=1 Tax=Penicillium daleae TaxID=63821 RepID=A0AAD6C1C3_9EURO|nr:Hnm1p [Penicillium daleae]KAJ5443716.1 Hnm1p [Penicillium daleae]